MMTLFAQAAAAPIEEIVPHAQLVLDAVVVGRWWSAVAAALAILALLVKRYGAKLWAPLATTPGVILSTFLLAFFGGLANSFAAGVEFSLAAITTAASIGLSAAGGWGALEVLWKTVKPKADP